MVQRRRKKTGFCTSFDNVIESMEHNGTALVTIIILKLWKSFELINYFSFGQTERSYASR